MQLPQGFRYAGVHCGIKTDPAKADLTIVFSDTAAAAAAVYTQNKVCAAPVTLDKQRTPAENMRAVVVNSGNANACTGERGDADARKMAQLTEAALNISEGQSLVMSTGIIGEFLPMEKIAAGIQAAAGSLDSSNAGFSAAADGITTTDISQKTTFRQPTGSGYSIAGMAKGTGMIGPNMATMLGILTTDANLAAADAQAALQTAVDASFNCISVEGHTSTNDTVALLANGRASDQALSGDSLASFTLELTEMCIELAKMIPADGEGATHIIEIQVQGCAEAADADQIARTVAASNLVKTAVTGADPNWGRIVSAAGYAGVDFDPTRVSLHVNNFLLYENGTPVAFDAKAASEAIRTQPETKILLQFGEGSEGARHWTSDLTVEYVKFNSEYTT